MSNNSNNVHFSGERLICNPYLIIIVPRFARADNDKIRAANESSALKMNIIVILRQKHVFYAEGVGATLYVLHSHLDLIRNIVSVFFFGI